MRKLLKFAEQGIHFLMVGSLGLMVILVFMNVVLRYFLGTGIAWSEEMSRFLFVWLTFIGAAVAFKDHEHLGVDVLVKRLPLWLRKIVFVISHLLMLLMCALIVYGSWKLMRLNFNSHAPSTGLPLSFLYMAGMIMGVVVFFILLSHSVKAFMNRASNDFIDVKESEEMIDYPAVGKEEKPT